MPKLTNGSATTVTDSLRNGRDVSHNRRYIRATSSTCYDRTGIIFPHEAEGRGVNLMQLVMNRISSQTPMFRWAKEFGYSNLVEVLCFNCTDAEADGINDALPYGLMVQSHWNAA